MIPQEIKTIYDQAKYQLTIQLTIFLSVVLFLLSTYFFIIDLNGYIQYGAGFFLSLVSFLILKKTKKFYFTAYLLSYGATLLVSLSVFLERDSLHLIDPLWFISVMIYAFYILGRINGIIITVYSSCVMFFHFNFLIAENIESVYNQGITYGLFMSFEYLVCILFICYFAIYFIRSVRDAEKMVSSANREIHQKNALLQQQNDEKTLLLQEIHHRVKNNLQIIISLLRMQSNEMESNDAKKDFQEAINRVMSMSLLHQRMYEGNELNGTEIKIYIQKLVDDLIAVYDPNKKINVHIIVQLHHFGMKTSIPVGLMLTELISNSMKYAFSEDGEVTIQILPSNDDYFIMTYFDNGKWKEPKGKSFGVSLIETLTEQLEGTYEFSNNTDGSLYQFKLKNID
jgi:two-component sensor histidine kinase